MARTCRDFVLDDGSEPRPGHIPQRAFTISFDEQRDWIATVLRTYGVVIVTEVLPADVARASAEAVVADVQRLGGKGLNPSDLRSWKFNKLLPTVSSGRYRSRVGACASVWAVRTDARVRAVFEEAYTGLRGRPVTQLATSIEGADVMPPKGPYYVPDARQWAEVDAATLAGADRCVEGMVVLNDTSGGMCVSPRSHLVHKDIVDMQPREDMAGVRRGADVGTWCRVTRPETVRKVLDTVGGVLQMPIVVPAGAMVLWLSSTLHAFKLQEQPAAGGGAHHSSGDGFCGSLPNWIVTVPVCMRPADEVCAADYVLRRNAVRRGLMTNAHGTRLYDRVPLSQVLDDFDPAVRRHVDARADGRFAPFELTPAQRSLLYHPKDDAPWSLELEKQVKPSV